MNTKLLSALALLPILFAAACDDPADLDPQTAEMIEICEELDGDCDEEIELYLAEFEAQVEAQAAAEDAVPFDPPDGLTTLPACTHCNDGPRRQFHTATARAQAVFDDTDLDLAAGPDEIGPCPEFEYDELRNPS